MCVTKRQEDSCFEWQIYKSFRCPGYDLLNVYVNHDVTKCQDYCLANQPDCVGFTVNIDKMCYLKTKLAKENCKSEEGFTTGELGKYD